MAKQVSSTESISHIDFRAIGQDTMPKPLAKNYGDTRITLMPRDPFHAFTYWELAPGTRDELKRKYAGNGRGELAFALRVYDVTGVMFDGRNAVRYFSIEINPYADNWYINSLEPGRNWCVDLCVVTETGEYITIARSNTVKMPRFGVSYIEDEKWFVARSNFERMVRQEQLERIGKSSLPLTKAINKGMEEIRYYVSGIISSLSVSSHARAHAGQKR
jgi:uncharacterized protein